MKRQRKAPRTRAAAHQANAHGDNLVNSVKIIINTANSDLLQMVHKRDEQIDRLIAIIANITNH